MNLPWNRIAQPNADKTPTPYPYGSLLFNLSGLGPGFLPLLQRYLCSFLFKISLFSSIPKSTQQQAHVAEAEVCKTVLFSSRGRLTSARRLYKTAYFSRLSIVKLFVFRPHSRLFLWRFACAFFPEKTNNTKKRKGDNGKIWWASFTWLLQNRSTQKIHFFSQRWLILNKTFPFPATFPLRFPHPNPIKIAKSRSRTLSKYPLPRHISGPGIRDLF